MVAKEAFGGMVGWKVKNLIMHLSIFIEVSLLHPDCVNLMTHNIMYETNERLENVQLR